MNQIELSIVLKALAAPSRLKIVELLTENAYCVNALTRRLDISQPAVSQHLAVLRKAGLVAPRKIGVTVHYELNTRRLEGMRRALDAIG